MECTIIFTMYYIAISLINSIGKKWDDELRGIWEYGFKSYMSWVWIPLILDSILIILTSIIKMKIYG